MPLPELFGNPENFAEHIMNEGHKQYYISKINAYVQSLFDLDTLYWLQVLPSDLNQNNGRQAWPLPTLEGSQLVALTIVKKIISKTKQFIDNFGQIGMYPSDVEWWQFLLVFGQPGTGKTHTDHKLIKFCADNMLSVTVGVRTGILLVLIKRDMKS